MKFANGRTPRLKYHVTKNSPKAVRIIAERFIQLSFSAICSGFDIAKVAKIR
jgi:hypothetical protein